MAELQSIARPYAKAAFEYADACGELPKWQAALQGMATVAAHAEVKSLLANPKVTNLQMAVFFTQVLSKILNDESKNFLYILAERGRLEALPYISNQFQTLYEEKQQTITAKVFVADALSEEQSKKIKAALEKRLKCDVELDTIIDPTIYGGVRVEAKDMVIDGSIRGRLRQLFENLNVYS